VLHLTIGLGDVDVNVHPSKTEIKFADDRLLFDSIYYTVKNALEESATRLQMTLSPDQEEEDTPKPTPQEAPRAPEKPAAKKNPAQTPFSQSYPGKQNFFQTMSAEQFRESIQKTPDRKDTLPSPPPQKPVPSRDHAQQPASDAPWLIPQPEDELPVLILTDGEEETPILRLETDAEPEYKVEPLPPNQCLTRLDERESAEEVANQLVHSEEEEAATPAPEPESEPVPEPEPVSEPESEPAPIPWKVVGELFHTYILVEQGDTVVLIDKHAAHERMNFDRLKAQDYRPMAQQLLTPLVIRPSRQEGRALLDHLSLLEEFGFDLEDFGDGAILVRQVPYDIEPGEAEATLSELAGKLLTTGRLDPSAARDELLHTMACKAAIKGGQKNGPEELQRVAEDVMADRVRYCPHGRPVAIELTRKQLEKQFKRT
jgi:DNA mismatch repair protein MutL